MGVDFLAVYESALNRYEQAFENIELRKSILAYESRAISDVIPGFEAEKLEFGSFAKENYAVLFVDMRQSTKRAHDVGPEVTFLTMHVFLTSLLEIVKYHNGKVIDIMGDGLMVFWGGEAAREKDYEFKSAAVKKAGLCGRDMLTARVRVINRIVSEKKLGPSINIGVGVTFGSVVVTKIGVADTYDVKAFGDCVNVASKYANKATNQVLVSQKVKNEWPSSKNGKISFAPSRVEGAYVLESGN